MQHEIQHKTRRRTPDEKKTAEIIDELAAKAKRDLTAERRQARLLAAAKRSSRYEFNRGYSSIDDAPIRYFYHKGESVTGLLGPAQAETFMAATYPLKQEDGRIIRVTAHRRLRQAIETGKRVGQNVTIIYEGRLLTKWGGHCEKLYTVTAAGEPPVSTQAPPRSQEAEDEKNRRQIAQELRDSRRDNLKQILLRNKTFGAKTVKMLQDFAGEAWADQALAKAKGGK